MKGVFVLGTGRCGTSAAARLINLIGLPLSIPGDVMDRPTPTNSTGSWESEALAGINEALLRLMGGSSLAPPPLTPRWWEQSALDEIRDRARSDFERVYPGSGWAWKDPRNCTTLPFWIDIAGVSPVAIVVTRDLLEVRDSLQKATARSEHLALAIWERRTRDMLQNIVGLPTYVTTFESLLGDPVAWCDSIATFLNGVGLGTLPTPADQVRAFIDPALRSSPEVERAGEGVSLEQRTLFETVQQLVGAHERFELPPLPPVTPWAELLLAEYRSRYILDLEEAREWLDGQWRTWQEKAERLELEVADAERGTLLALLRRAGRAIRHRNTRG